VAGTEFQRGIELFNAGHYFQAHEVLEDVWRAAPAGQKQFFQGLVQVAVALHHHSRGNRTGARSVLARSMANLAGYPDSYGGIDLAALRATLNRCQQALARGDALLPPLRMQFSGLPMG
jgi:hypothetical protein